MQNVYSKLILKHLLGSVIVVLATGCFGVVGPKNEDSSSISYSIELHEEQEKTTSKLPIRFYLTFDKAVKWKKFNTKSVTAKGSANVNGISISTLKRNKKYLVEVYDVRSFGSVRIALDFQNTEVFNGELQVQSLDSEVEYISSSSNYKLVNVFNPIDAAGSMTPLGDYDGRFYYISEDSIYSVDSNYGSRMTHSANTFTPYWTQKIGSKLVGLYPDGSIARLTAYDFTSKKFINLMGSNPSNKQIYYKSDCTLTTCNFSLDYSNKVDDFKPFLLFKNKIIFGMDDGIDSSIYFSEITSGEPSKISTITSTSNLDIKWLGAGDTYAYFAQFDGTTNCEFYYTDGTNLGTGKITGGHQLNCSQVKLNETFVFGDHLFFRNNSGDYYKVVGAQSPTSVANIGRWRYKGDSYVWFRSHKVDRNGNVISISPIISSSSRYGELEGELYFTSGSYPRKFYKIEDGTGSHIQLSDATSSIRGVWKNKIILTTSTPAHGVEVYSYDPVEGLRVMVDLTPGPGDTTGSISLVAQTEEEVFILNETKLYSTKGDYTTAQLLAEMPYYGNSWSNYVMPDNSIFAAHSDEDHNKDLFFVDSGNIKKVADLNTTRTGLNIKIEDAKNGVFLFDVTDQSGSNLNWVSKGSNDDTKPYTGSIGTRYKGKMFIEKLNESTGFWELIKSNYVVEYDSVISTNMGINNPTVYINPFDEDYLVFQTYSDSTTRHIKCFNTKTETISNLIDFSNLYIGEVTYFKNNQLLITAGPNSSNYHLYHANCDTSVITQVTSTTYNIIVSFLEGSDIYFSDRSSRIYKASISTNSESLWLDAANAPFNMTFDDVANFSIADGSPNLFFTGYGSNFLPYYANLSDKSGGILTNDIETGTDRDLYSFMRYDPVDKILGKILLRSDSRDYWLTDGTTAGTWKLLNVTNYDPLDEFSLVQNNELFVFPLYARAFSTDGTPGSKTEYASPTSYAVSLIKAEDSSVAYIRFLDPSDNSYSLYKLENAVLTLVVDDLDFFPLYFDPHDKKLYGRVSTSEHGSELWITDGSAGGTKLFADLEPGEESSSPVDVIRSGSKLMVVTHSRNKLWYIDL